MTDNRIVWDWDFLQELSDVDRAYNLNDREVNFLLNIAPQFEWDSRWFNTGASVADDRASFGHDVMYKIMNPIEVDTGTGSLGECFRMDTTTEVFKFHPNNPFETNPDVTPPVIMSGMKWVRWADLPINNFPVLGGLIEAIAGGATGYFPNDCFVTFDEQALFDTPITSLGALYGAITSMWFPTVEIEMIGEGQLEIELVQSPLGGSFVLIPDLDISISAVVAYILDFFDNDGSLPSAWKFVEVNRDITALPPELIVTQITEFEFVGETTHTLLAIFIPRLNDEFPFFNPFGGIREIEACGSLRIVGAETNKEFDFTNFRDETSMREGVIMSTVDDIRLGVHLGINDVMKHAIAGHGDGVTSNIIDDLIIGKSGDIAVSKDSGILVPEYDSNVYEKNNGSAYNQALQFSKLFTDTDEQITASFSNNLIIKSLQYITHSPALIQFVIADYIATASPVIIDVPALAELIYCMGSFESGLFLYASNPANHGEDDFGYILSMASEVQPTALAQWYADGVATPRTLYTAYACYRQPMMSYVYDVANPPDRNPHSWFSAEHGSRIYRVEIDVNEVLVDDMGREYDGIYIKETNNALDTWTRLRLNAVSGNISMQTIPAHLGGTGKYILTYVSGASLITGTYFYAIGLERAWGTTVSGSIEIKIYDIGAV